MISFSAPTYNPLGSVVYQQEPSQLFVAQRRATVTATLDGGVSVYDTGYSVSDRNVKVQIKQATLDQINAIAYLIQLYPRLIVSTRAGCFSALVEYAVNVRTLNISIRFIEALS
jgi:hypothetical protein